MDLLDLVWNISQEHQIHELRGHLEQERLKRDLDGGAPHGVKELAEENLELKLRLGLLVRLLINKGVITAPEYAALIAETRSKT
jgi:hypothetical protein